MTIFNSKLTEKIIESLSNDYQIHLDNWFVKDDYYIRAEKKRNVKNLIS